MTDIQRIRVAITGFPGAPGVATFFASATDTTAVAALATYYGAVKGFHPGGVSFDIPGTGDLIDDATGTITGVWTQSGSATQTSATPANIYIAGACFRTRWVTGGIVHGRRVTGTTFLGPILASSFENDGSPLGTSLTTVRAAAVALVAAADLYIWSRPYQNKGGSDPIPTRAGSSHLVIGTTTPDLTSGLRSRRV